jgi:ATP-dependent helicase HrpA
MKLVSLALDSPRSFRYRPRLVRDEDVIAELKELLPRCLTADWVRIGSQLTRLVRDEQSGARRSNRLNGLLRKALESVAFRERRAEDVPRVRYPAELPITARAEDIVAAIRDNPVVVIAGETGSGKTTQIPKMCLASGLGIAGKIACTQPRRVAAQSVSKRIAEELSVKWGKEVGCKIRFDDRSSPQSYIKMMTDGMLLAELQGDPNLAEYDAIIVDEAHERSLNIDFILGHLKRLLERRDDLKVIITSATIDTERFSEHFGKAPVIEVSGRMYPVEVEYQPLDHRREERGEVTFVDAAVAATEQILYTTDTGDVLIFMPGERDIRETRDRVERQFGGDVEVVPLFGRLSSADQQRVFSSSPRRKVVIATNIAETSLTIPGIRYVIDTGLARMSRYSPRTRTRRLPVEPVSQSSANQRKGRAGRLEDGICIRLYSEEEFKKRQPFTQPEIQRSNLAEVILRMKAFRLGDIETFPFVQPPSPAAITAGYNLLHELGALDKQRELTQLGHKLARLPIDPTLGRMLLQAQQEHATHELLIIAAGLSIQDPRERPLDKQAAAESAHKRFNSPISDFLTLLRIWNAVHDEWESLRTQNARRKFCRQNFLSYPRMRDWQDLHAQLLGALKDLGDAKLNESNANEDAIHRSVLAGLIAHVGRREERNVYRSSGNREVKVFPGSVLHERRDPKKKQAGKRRPPETRTNQPRWIVAGEMVETSQLFARTLAGIDPQWIFNLAPHCCQMTHREPHWSATSGRVLAQEVVTLYGMEVIRRKVPFSKIDPKEATIIFIRDALVEESLVPDDQDDENAFAAKYPFIVHNQAVCRKVEHWLTRVRRHDIISPQEALQNFYGRQLESVSSLHELNAWLKQCPSSEVLHVAEQDLVGDEALNYDDDAFPEKVTVSGQTVEVSYSYAPGEEHDGATVQVPFTVAQSADAAVMEWAVPGLREKFTLELLRSLPKSLRRELMPLPNTVEIILNEFTPTGDSIAASLGDFVRSRLGITIPLSAWSAEDVPHHLRPRIEVIGSKRQSLKSGRDLNQLRDHLDQQQVATARVGEEPPEWRQAMAQWEKFDLRDWTVGDPPERITVRDDPDLPLYAWTGFEYTDGCVNFRLYSTPEAAKRSSPVGVAKLIQMALHKDLGWLEKDLRSLHAVRDLYAPLGTVEELQDSTFNHALGIILPVHPLTEMSEERFRSAVVESRTRIPGLAQKLIDHIKAVLEARQKLIGHLGIVPKKKSAPKRTLTDLSQLDALGAPVEDDHPFSSELNRLLSPRFPERIDAEHFPHLPRYLKALGIRAERARLNPRKDVERAALVVPYQEQLVELLADAGMPASGRKLVQELRWMIEEYRVSIFAQELGTSVKVSPKRLDSLIESIRRPGISSG